MYKEPDYGESFYDFIHKVVNELDENSYTYVKFDDIVICVHKDSHYDDISIIYLLKCKLRRLEKK